MSFIKKIVKFFLLSVIINFSFICLGSCLLLTDQKNLKSMNLRSMWEKSNIFCYSKSYLSELERAACHEAGHALIAALNNLKIKLMSIAHNSPDCREFVTAYTPKTIYHTLQVLLAGYAAEEIIFGEAGYGICLDLDEATEAALLISQNSILNSKKRTLEQILQKHLEKIRAMLLENIESLHALASAVLENKTLTGEEIYSVIKQAKTHK